MDSAAASRNLLLAIDEFKQTHGDDDRCGEVISKLDEARDEVVELVPSARRDPDESPGRRVAREIAEESRGKRDDDEK